MKKIILFIFLMLSSQIAISSSMTKTCSGRMRYCDRYGICSQEHFYLYAYQNIILNSDGSLRKHKFKLKTRSILGDPQFYTARDIVEGDHLVFDGPDFSLAIPWSSNQPIFYFQPNFGVYEWQELCP